MAGLSRSLRVAAYALICDSGKILLCRLSKEVPKWPGYWTLPGGGLEFGESPEQAMVREVEEETGLRVRPRVVATIDTLVRESADIQHHGIRIIYHVDLVGGALRNELSGSTDGCQWHPLPPGPEVPLVELAKTGIDACMGQEP